MNKRFKQFSVCSLIAMLSIPGSSCQKQNEVIAYTSLDRNLSEPIFNRFEEISGINVRVVYDTEANKTIGLVNRLIAEKNQPRADVFWNNEYSHTIKLSGLDILLPYKSPSIPVRIYNKIITDSNWTPFAARARVFIVNTKLVRSSDEPHTIYDLTDPRWKGKAAIANPNFGTTGTHFTGLLVKWGTLKFTTWLKLLKQNQVAILPGNAQVKDKVVRGEYAIGLTDTDDVNGAILDGKRVKMIIPDQSEQGVGVFLIPGTVALIKGGPNTQNGKVLIDYLLSADVEKRLAGRRGAQIPILHAIKGPTNIPPLSELKVMRVNYDNNTNKFKEMLKIFNTVWNE